MKQNTRVKRDCARAYKKKSMNVTDPGKSIPKRFHLLFYSFKLNIIVQLQLFVFVLFCSSFNANCNVRLLLASFPLFRSISTEASCCKENEKEKERKSSFSRNHQLWLNNIKLDESVKKRTEMAKELWNKLHFDKK